MFACTFKVNVKNKDDNGINMIFDRDATAATPPLGLLNELRRAKEFLVPATIRRLCVCVGGASCSSCGSHGFTSDPRSEAVCKVPIVWEDG